MHRACCALILLVVICAGYLIPTFENLHNLLLKKEKQFFGLQIRAVMIGFFCWKLFDVLCRLEKSHTILIRY